MPIGCSRSEVIPGCPAASAGPGICVVGDQSRDDDRLDSAGRPANRRAAGATRDVRQREQRLLRCADVLEPDPLPESSVSKRVEHSAVVSVTGHSSCLEHDLADVALLEFVDESLETPSPAPLRPRGRPVVADDEDRDRVRRRSSHERRCPGSPSYQCSFRIRRGVAERISARTRSASASRTTTAARTYAAWSRLPPGSDSST